MQSASPEFVLGQSSRPGLIDVYAVLLDCALLIGTARPDTTARSLLPADIFRCAAFEGMIFSASVEAIDERISGVRHRSSWASRKRLLFRYSGIQAIPRGPICVKEGDVHVCLRPRHQAVRPAGS
jgi:hypothetical protein